MPRDSTKSDTRRSSVVSSCASGVRGSKSASASVGGRSTNRMQRLRPFCSRSSAQTRSGLAGVDLVFGLIVFAGDMSHLPGNVASGWRTLDRVISIKRWKAGWLWDFKVAWKFALQASGARDCADADVALKATPLTAISKAFRIHCM
jgi:hypothetical protein